MLLVLLIMAERETAKYFHDKYFEEIPRIKLWIYLTYLCPLIYSLTP